ncbi:curli production assembly protein CsgF [Kushneria pakistanensis]|uniref:Curli production assembly/transport component CsgF n=1 Tax=Kushneria pakistanensis TaxID=1508770 RepID=A0ABQ3FEW3_9GAMM|nr:curli assembly protein CsgF [Kushneria pakistanensis]GHC21213.1 curli production assembly protein CsgF [Kushneria pakistanensis]
MKALRILPACALMLTTLVSANTQAGNLVYQPLNPSFGGDPFYGSYLLGKAQAQDTHTDPNVRGSSALSATDRLVQSLQSRLISQLIGDISSGELGEGSFESNDFSIVIREDNDLVSLRILDKLTGDVTDIQVGGLFNP